MKNVFAQKSLGTIARKLAETHYQNADMVISNASSQIAAELTKFAYTCGLKINSASIAFIERKIYAGAIKDVKTACDMYYKAAAMQDENAIILD